MKNNISKITTQNPDETEKTGESFASQIKPGDIVCLYGELGAGKTTFVRGFVKGLGFEDRVMSPTFTIIRTYQKNNIKKMSCYHIDLYRLDEKIKVESLGIDEILADKSSVVLIEWPERMRGALPKKRWDVIFDAIGDFERSIEYIKNE